MTPNQRITLMADWWPKACAAQGWNKNDRAKRLEVLSQAVGRPLLSANQLHKKEDIDHVKEHLMKLADNLAGVMNAQDQTRIRTRHTIRELADEPYIQELLNDRFRWAVWVRKHCPTDKHGLKLEDAPDNLREDYEYSAVWNPALEDLTQRELIQLLGTLKHRINDPKKRAQQGKDAFHSVTNSIPGDLCPASGPPWSYDSPDSNEPF